MRATTIHGPGDIRFEEVADPVIKRPTDAIVKVVAGCVCGSDLWPYRGANPIRAARRSATSASAWSRRSGERSATSSPATS